MRPDYWTVFNEEKAAEAARAAHAQGHQQALIARIQAPGDTFYSGHEGGFDAGDVEAVADTLDRTPGGRFAGLTTFPALLFDEASGEAQPTPNLATLHAAAERLARQGRRDIVINAPGTTSAQVMAALADGGATQVEPGHGLTGTTPLHARTALPERPAMLYLTEVSHFHQGRAYCFGGGLYIDPVFAPYPLKTLVGADPEAALAQEVEGRHPGPGDDRLLRAASAGLRPACRGRRYGDLRLPRAGLLHPRPHRADRRHRKRHAGGEGRLDAGRPRHLLAGAGGGFEPLGFAAARKPPPLPSPLYGRLPVARVDLA